MDNLFKRENKDKLLAFFRNDPYMQVEVMRVLAEGGYKKYPEWRHDCSGEALWRKITNEQTHHSTGDKRPKSKDK